jgi:hypothetical protein
VSFCCENLVSETNNSSGTEKNECLPLEAATKQRLMKETTDLEYVLCPTVICEVPQ